MFVKLSPGDRLVCFADIWWDDSAGNPSVATTRQLFSQSLSSNNLCTVLKLFRPVRTSAVSGTKNSNKPTPTRFAAGKIYLRRNRIAVLPKTSASVCLSSRWESMKKILGEWSELQVAECLKVHVLSIGYNISSFELWKETKVTQQ